MDREGKKNSREQARAEVKLPVMFMGKGMDVASAVYSETANITGNGACVYSSVPLNPSSELSIGLFLPKGSKAADETTLIHCAAVVVYSGVISHESGRSSYYIGVEFTNIENKDRRLLYRFVMDCLKKKEVSFGEKRREARAPARLQAVLVGPDFTPEGAGYAETRDINSYGSYFVSRKYFHLLTDLQVRIFIPARSIAYFYGEEEFEENKVITCRARVVRVEGKTGKDIPVSEFGLGVEFFEMSEADKNILQEFLLVTGKEKETIKFS